MLLVLVCALIAPAAPQSRVDAHIPTLRSVAGHEAGERLTSPEQALAYLDALAAAAPERARVVEYGTSEGGRPLRALVIAAPERLARLEALKAELRTLADPRRQARDGGARLVAEAPLVVWIMAGVHGDEVSPCDAALALAYRLLAAEEDPVADLVRREAVVIVDPLANPDGRARFLAANEDAQGETPDPEPTAAEHDQPWPGGRGNHALFDLNRDWLGQTQSETRGRVQLFLEWYPHVVLDLHEMDGDSTYYFAPPASPLNPHFSAAQQRWLDRLGRAIAARFDAESEPYFVREVFDNFYPGYAESWPMTHGSIGLTLEQASARGLAWERVDGSRLTYQDGVRNHLRALMAVLEAAAARREELLRDFVAFRRSAIEEAGRPASAYVVPRHSDAARMTRFGDLLARQGIELQIARGELRDGERRFAPGSLVVPADQPAGRLVRNLLDPDVALDGAFVREQERRRRKRLPDQIFDVTAWSLPALFDLECVRSAGLVGPRAAYAGGDAPVPVPAAKVGWLLPWGSGAAAASAAALHAGLKLRVVEGSFRLGGRAFPPGTALVRPSENPEDVQHTLSGIASGQLATVVAADSAFVEEGVSLGSPRVHALVEPRVLVAWGEPTSSHSAGWARWVLERRFGLRVSAVRVSALGSTDVRRFDVIVLPSGEYDDALDVSQVKRLRSWIEQGGTLVALGEASRWLTREKVRLLDTHTELRDGRPEPEPDGEETGRSRPDAASADDKEATPVFDLDRAVQPERESPEAVPGALLDVELDAEHWLAAGTDGRLQALVASSRVFTPLKLDKGTNVGLYAAEPELVAGGFVWREARRSLARKAFLMHQAVGEGHVIAFAEDPNYRGFSEATELVFVNAVLLGPAF